MTELNILNTKIELTEEETEEITGGREYYIIERGDTLTRIANRFGTTIKRLMKLNPQITDPNRIYAHRKIRVN